MSMLREGRMATFIGEGPNFGAHAEVLSVEPSAAWVRWVTGARSGEIELLDDLDLTPSDRSRYALVQEAAMHAQPLPLEPEPMMPSYAPQVAHQAVMSDPLDDSLDVGLPVRLGAAGVQQAQGTMGVLTMLAQRGDLHRLSTVVDEAMIMVANAIRNDVGVRQITAQLEDDDAENLVQMAALTLLHSAFGAA